MINNYGIFNYHESNNQLVILFGENRNKEEVINKEISLLKRDDEVVGYAINNFIKYAKIKYSGIIFLPSDALIDVINSVLENNGLEPLDYKTSSGYIIKTTDNQKIVFAKEGTYLRDESVSKGHVCSYEDLYIKSDDSSNILILDDDSLVGGDFFLTEAK